jgi:lactoylglutathione lyase
VTPRPRRDRPMDEPGLTHISVSCDVADVCARIPDYGGEVLRDTDIGVAVFVRDPDGQLVELLPMSYRDHV